MLHFFKFSPIVESPLPASEVYVKRGPGKGWPEECPPLRAANAFGWDVPASFDMAFRRLDDGSWTIEEEVEVESDWVYRAGASPGDGPHGREGLRISGPRELSGTETGTGTGTNADPDADGITLTQKNAWFWEKGQTLPHAISPQVYPEIRNQVKVSTFLFVHTDPNELLLITDIPNLKRPFRVVTALVETDWYPASYPWHCVIELDPAAERIAIAKGTPLCRLMTVRRDTYFAREMSPVEFDAFFRRGQEWLLRHGKGERSDMMDITRAYGRQQQKPRFTVTL